jgi:hypothetical protein
MRNIPRLQLGFGFSTHSFSMSGLEFSGVANHEEQIPYRMDGTTASNGNNAFAFSFDMRFTASITRHLYAGVGGSIGKMWVERRRSIMSDGLLVESSGGIYLAGGAVAGIAIPAGNLTIRAETAVQRRMVGLAVTTRHLDCESSSVVHDGEWVVAPRVSVARWLSPWTSVGIAAGTDVLHSGGASIGVFFQAHPRAFDGTRSR